LSVAASPLLFGVAVTFHRTAERGGGDAGITDPYLRFTGGVDRTFSRVPGERFSFIAQYSLDTAREVRGTAGQQELNPLLHPFRHALVLNTMWPFTEFRRFSVKGYLNLEDGDYVLQPEFSWQPKDALTITIGGDVLGGKDHTFFGRFRHNDRIRARLAYAL
jgi:hypothetical protein